MAVGAAPVDHEEAIWAPGDGLMSSLHMTALAEPEQAGPEQLVMVGAVGGMTGVAILLHRGMLPQDRTAELSVALVAGVVDRIRHHHRGRLAAVGIVAACARHLSLFHRVGRALIQMPLHLHVAGIARLGDAGSRQDGLRRLRIVGAVAVDTCNAAGLMDAALPEHLLDILGMARAHALGVLHLDGLGAFPEGDDRLDGFTGRVHVQAAGAVA